LRQSKGASVINIASMYGTVSPDPAIYGDSGLNSPPAYGPAKAALIQLTRYMACHWGTQNIRVNAIAPGPFPRDEFQRSQPAFTERLAAKTPLKRIGRAEEIGGAVTFLASDAASYITGAVLPVDGGWTAW
jgi:NAD(P)-dependent dehydrogenase (short-subunit alcohol dehydrogenase family)